MKFTKLYMDSESQLLTMEFETYPECNPVYVKSEVHSALGDQECFKGISYVDPNRYLIYIDCKLYQPQSDADGHLLVFTKMMLTADEIAGYLYETFQASFSLNQ